MCEEGTERDDKDDEYDDDGVIECRLIMLEVLMD